jgi:hypothetical protein
VNRTAIGIVLQCQDAPTAKPFGIILDSDSSRHVRQDILDEDSIFRKFRKTVVRKTNITSKDQSLYAAQNFAHGRQSHAAPQVGAFVPKR